MLFHRASSILLPALFAALSGVSLFAQGSSPPSGSGLQGLYRAVRNGSDRPAGAARVRRESPPPLYSPGKRVRTDTDDAAGGRAGPPPKSAREADPLPAPRYHPESRRSLPFPEQQPGRTSPKDRRAAPPEVPKSPPTPKAEAKHNQEQKPGPPSAAAAPSLSKKPTRTGFPTTLVPTPKSGFRYRPPKFYEGIYVTNSVARTPRLYKALISRSRAMRINTIVVDVQPRLPPVEFIRLVREAGFYLVARVVVFPGGLKEYPPRSGRIHRTLDIAEEAARNGFMEVQLDYIRFADRIRGRRHLSLSLRKRYRLIEGILKMATDRIRPHGVRVGADVFGRIAFNNDDIIGQQVELFAAHLDTIYPMLYPSHFYGEPHRIRNPYGTVLLGNRNAVERSQGNSKIVAYIQGFRMSVGPSGLSYENYIRKQIAAAEDSGGAGYIVWNARNRYGPFFRALAQHRRLKLKRGLTHNEPTPQP